MKNITERIYLQIGEADDIQDVADFNELYIEAISWCADKINDSDIEYTRSFKVEPGLTLQQCKEQIAKTYSYLDANMTKIKYESWEAFIGGASIQDTEDAIDEILELYTASLTSEIKGLREKVKNNAIEFAKFIADFTDKGNEDYGPDNLTLVDGNWYWRNDNDGDQTISEDQLYKWFEDTKNNH